MSPLGSPLSTHKTQIATLRGSQHVTTSTVLPLADTDSDKRGGELPTRLSGPSRNVFTPRMRTPPLAMGGHKSS